MAEVDDTGFEIDDAAFAVLRDLLDGKRRDYRKIADELGFAPEDVARGIVRSLRSAAHAGEVRVLLESLGVETRDVLRAAEAQSPDTLAALVLKLNLERSGSSPPATATPVPDSRIRDNTGRAAAVIASAVLAQWVIAWGVLSLPDRAGLARLDWWQSMTHVLLFTGVGVGLVLVAARVILRLSIVSWRGGLALSVLTCSLLSSLGFAEIQQVRIRDDLNAVFLEHRWVAYDPPEFNPYKGEERSPTPEEMERDLGLLRQDAGFDGLITFKSVGTLAQIPALAKKVGFRKVIMGVYVVLDSQGSPDPVGLAKEMDAAVAAREWVDGYCLGHNAPTVIEIAALKKWMTELRKRTGGKPVTTTAPLVSYLGERGQQLREIGDWYFPDVRGSWVYGAPPEKLMEELQQAVRDVTTLPPDRPVLLKMISCPAGPEPRYSPQAQAEFYRWLQRDLYLPSGVFLSYYNGFDLPWMSHDKRPTDWSPGQQYVGFFTADGQPRPSVAVVREGFPVQRRP